MPKEKKYPLPFGGKEAYDLSGKLFAALMNNEISINEASTASRNLSLAISAYAREVTKKKMPALDKLMAAIEQHGFTFEAASGDYLKVAGLPDGHRLHLFLDAAKRPVAVLKAGTVDEPYSQELKRWQLTDVADEIVGVIDSAQTSWITS